MYQDMSHNRPTEVDYINGYLVKLGQKHQYQAKTHAFLTHLVHLAETTRQAAEKTEQTTEQANTTATTSATEQASA
jgi:2-dehydropantoate 2-reductase